MQQQQQQLLSSHHPPPQPHQEKQQQFHHLSLQMLTHKRESYPLDKTHQTESKFQKDRKSVV